MPKVRPDSNYEWSTAAWRRIAMDTDILAACVAEAERAKVYAEGLAPVDSGQYKASFKVSPTTTTFPVYGTRVSAELANEAPYAAAIEFGNSRSAQRRVMQQTAAYLGGGP